MRISDLVKMGLRNLGRRKARTALTVIGIVIGTISIVVMISIGVGMNESFRESLLQFGSVTEITVSKINSNFENGKFKESKQKIDDKLFNTLKVLPHVKGISPVIRMNFKLKSGTYETNINVSAMDAKTFKNQDFPALKNGKNFDISNSRNKIKLWIGNYNLSNFYNPNSYDYNTKTIDPTKARVVLFIDDPDTMPYDDKGNLAINLKEYNTDIAVFDASDYSQYNYSAYMDIGQFNTIYKEYSKKLPFDKKKKADKKLKEYDSIVINADSVENVKEIQEKIKELGYTSTSMSDFTSQLENFSKTIQLVLGGVGAVSMLVAAISIANTMIMSIYERTKEIGIMKVLGCQISDIKKLFLFEAAIMGLFGGVIGISLSYGVSALLNKFGGVLGQALNMFGGESSKLSVIPIWLPFLAAAFAMAVGVVSGYYPASRATKISAIEAMKNE